MDAPKISVIMPVYNSALYLEQAIQSILNQTFTDFELLIFNDGSKDNSSKIIKEIRDERIHFFDDFQNTGYVTRLNEGLKVARGKYIARMDSDDIALPERFHKQVALLESRPEIGICGTSFLAFGDHSFIADMPVTDLEIREVMLTNNPLGHPTVMIRKSIIDNYNFRYKYDAVPVEDYFMWYEISKVTQLHNLPDILLKYRRHDSQISVVKNETQRLNVNELRLTQLLDKGFVLSDEEQRLYCAIVDNSIQSNNKNELITIISLMLKITLQNKKTKAYRPVVFKKIFSNSWNRLVREIQIHNPNHIYYALINTRYVSSSLTLTEKLRFGLKSLLSWKI